MPAYGLIVALHVLAGAVGLFCFWSAAVLRKGSPRHRAVGKGFLLAMLVVMLTSLPMAVEFAWYRQQPLIALYLLYLMALTGNALWLSWRAVTDKRDWRVLVARPGWALSLWPMLLFALAVLLAGMLTGRVLFLSFSLIGLWAGWRMWRFARRGPQRPDWALRQHYQSMLGAGIATHVGFLSIGMRPVWRWLHQHTQVSGAVIELFPWIAPVSVALLASWWLERRYGRSRAAAATSR